MSDTRPKGIRSFQFSPLADCRRQFAIHIDDPDLKWDEPDETEPIGLLEAINQVAPKPHQQTPLEVEPDVRPEPEYEPEDDCREWEPDLYLDDEDYAPEYEAV